MLQAAWDRVDRDESGTIDYKELEDLLEILYHGPPPEKEVQRVMDYFDTNKDGKITWKEFQSNLARLQGESVRYG